MGAKTCPECGLLVDERHQFCGCGYDWADEPRGRVRSKPDPRPSLGWVAAVSLVLIILSSVFVVWMLFEIFVMGNAP